MVHAGGAFMAFDDSFQSLETHNRFTATNLSGHWKQLGLAYMLTAQAESIFLGLALVAFLAAAFGAVLFFAVDFFSLTFFGDFDVFFDFVEAAVCNE